MVNTTWTSPPSHNFSYANIMHTRIPPNIIHFSDIEKF